MIYVIAYIAAAAILLTFNYCAGTLNKESAEKLGEDYYGE